MHKELLRSMEGIEIYGIVALIIFMAVFLVWLFLTLSIRQEHAQEMGHLPLEDDLTTQEIKKENQDV